MAKRQNLIIATSGAAFLLGLGAVYLAVSSNTGPPLSVPAVTEQLPTVVVYKSLQCGCCQGWVNHMEEAGFRVTVKNVNDMRPIKVKYGIPPQVEACHTAIVGDYLVEGHVPADAVKRLLREQPNVPGIGVPGMPMGSPGMDQGSPANDVRYQVLAFDRNGGTSLYESY